MLRVSQLLGFNAGGGGPQITFLGTGTSVTNNPTVAMTTLAAVLAGETIILAWSCSASVSNLFSSASDGTNTYTEAAGSKANSTNANGSIAYKLNPAAISLGATITVTLNNNNTEKTVSAWKVNKTLAFDSAGAGTGATNAPSATTGGAIPTNGVVIGYCYNDDTDTFTALTVPWTMDVQATVGASSHTYIGQSEVVAVAGTVTYNPALSGPGTWMCTVAGFH